MLQWAGEIDLPVHVLLTKVDKLKKGQAANTLQKVRTALKQLNGTFSVQQFSSLKRTGVDTAHDKLDEWFQYGEQRPAPGGD
jgi:GTP-binding protein